MFRFVSLNSPIIKKIIMVENKAYGFADHTILIIKYLYSLIISFLIRIRNHKYTVQKALEIS